MRRQTVNISISLPRGIREQARQAAFDDNRSLSSLVSSLLRAYLCAEGYIEGGKSAGAGKSSRRPPRQQRLPGLDI